MNTERLRCPAIGSLGFRICLFLAVNPDEYLTSADAAQKFGVSPRTVFYGARSASSAGWLRRETPIRGKPSLFFAGPKLLAALGR